MPVCCINVFISSFPSTQLMNGKKRVFSAAANRKFKWERETSQHVAAFHSYAPRGRRDERASVVVGCCCCCLRCSKAIWEQLCSETAQQQEQDAFWLYSKRIWVGPDQPTRQMVVMRLTNIVFFTMLYIFDNKQKFLQAHFFRYYYYYYNNYTLTAVSTLNHWLNPNAPSILIYDALAERNLFLTGFWFDFVPSHARFRFKRKKKKNYFLPFERRQQIRNRPIRRHYRLLSSH